MENMFRDLDILENWYKNSIINLDNYFRIKSNIVDFYRNPKQEDDEDLPF